MNTEKRYVVTVDFYIYAETDAEAKKKAKNEIEIIKSFADNKAGLVSLHEVPFGTIGQAREIK